MKVQQGNRNHPEKPNRNSVTGKNTLSKWKIQ